MGEQSDGPPSRGAARMPYGLLRTAHACRYGTSARSIRVAFVWDIGAFYLEADRLLPNGNHAAHFQPSRFLSVSPWFMTALTDNTRPDRRRAPSDRRGHHRGAGRPAHVLYH